MAVKQWSAGFLPVLISPKPHTGVLTKPTPSSNLSAGPDRGLLCLNHLGLTRVEAQCEERAEHTIIRSPNLSLPLSLQPEERSIPRTPHRAPLTMGPEIPVHGHPLRISLPLPHSSFSPSFSLFLCLSENNPTS